MVIDQKFGERPCFESSNSHVLGYQIDRALHPYQAVGCCGIRLTLHPKPHCCPALHLSVNLGRLLLILDSESCLPSGSVFARVILNFGVNLGKVERSLVGTDTFDFRNCISMHVPQTCPV